MFPGEVHKWRVPTNKLTPIKQDIGDIDKLKLFEQGVDYIITSKATTPELIREILGFSNTKCEAFKKLSIDNSWLFADAITRETTYFMVLCCFKDVNIANKIEIPSRYINEVSLKGNIISFTKEPYTKVKIKFDKLRTAYNSISFSYTNKTNKLNIKELFHNHIHDNGKCRGSVKYWLEEMAKAYSLNKAKRTKHKDKFVKSLEIISDERDVEKKNFKNAATGYKISNYNEYLECYRKMRNIFDIYTSIKDLAITIDNIIKKMSLNNVSQIYMEIITGPHALGLIIIAKGDGLKFILYEPNDKLLYGKKFIHRDDCNISAYQHMYYNLSEIKELYEKDSNTSLLIKGYILANNKIVTNYIIDYPQISGKFDANNQKRLLGLAIINHDYNLSKEILSTTQIGVDYILADFDSTPLMFAIYYKDSEMVKILLEYTQQINMQDSQGKSALDIAVSLYQEEIIKLLISAGAETNKLKEDPYLKLIKSILSKQTYKPYASCNN
ncbi:MAG: ankyrin repeat domain-containing protein [Neisseriaceae bacterium]